MKIILLITIFLFINTVKLVDINEKNFVLSKDENIIELDESKEENMFCSDNPADEMTTIDVIKKCGYPVEEHHVTSEDGYILTLHRIPGKSKNSIPVLVHHAILESSFCWVVNGCKKGLAFILSDNGYDVWLANARGNTYSKGHINDSISDFDYWNFSWHEMGIYDVPAEINYITERNNQSLYYIGHSMGTTMYFVMSSERPEFQAKVKVMFGLAPVTFTGRIVGPFNFFGRLLRNLEEQNKIDGRAEFLAQNPVFQFLGKCVCNLPIIDSICSFIVFSTVGYNFEQFNKDMLPVILTHTPAGTSLKSLLHYAQGIYSKRFLKYDYGRERNLLIYNSEEPTPYDLSRVTTPVAFLWSENDFLADPKDVRDLYEKLPNTIGTYKISDPHFNHLDFLWARDAPDLVYKKILEIMKTYARA